ncbi:hypothetical protein V1508DRAFT_412289 [Lipomyces doorenjongii]|uniref:uncharacterized protein n=1 Tax=Lipomyces doorenjongii TaxID=383834 RepID=UPI0034CED39C
MMRPLVRMCTRQSIWAHLSDSPGKFNASFVRRKQFSRSEHDFVRGTRGRKALQRGASQEQGSVEDLSKILTDSPILKLPTVEEVVKTDTSNRELIDGIIDRIERRRDRLKHLAELSPLYHDPPDMTRARLFGEPVREKRVTRLEVGDLVADNEGQLGVIVKIVRRGSFTSFILLTTARSLRRVTASAIEFAIKEFTPEFIARNAIVYTTLDENDALFEGTAMEDISAEDRKDTESSKVNAIVAPPAVSRYVCQPLRLFQSEVLRLNSRIRNLIAQAHDDLAAKDDYRIYSLFEICDHIMDKFAVDKSLLNVFYYTVLLSLDDDTVRWTRTGRRRYMHVMYSATSVATVEKYEKGAEYLRDVNGPIAQEFIQKSRRLIRYYRSNISQGKISEDVTRVHSERLGKDVAFYHPDVTFTEEEQAIIEVVKHFVFLCSAHREDQMTRAIVGRFVREVDMWNDQTVDHVVVYQYLYEIGVFSPWYNTAMLNPLDRLPLDDLTKLKFKVLEKEMDNKVVTLQDLNFEDSMNGLRYDFGDLPVYCIDGFGAEEIDDGISIEYIEGGDECWLHVHVADPSAVVPPDHPIAIEASDCVETIYGTAFSRPMVPEALATVSGLVIKDGSDYCRALTFSARVRTSDATLLDVMVRPSIIRNVKSLIYDDVDRAMGWKMDFSDEGLPKQFQLPPNSSTLANYGTVDSLTSDDRDRLNEAYRISRLLILRRAKERASVRPFSFASLTVSSPPTINISDVSTERPLYYYPELSPQVNISYSNVVSRYFVAELMILASRVAARFATERNIPLPFRVQEKVEGISSREMLTDDDFTSHGFQKLKSLFSLGSVPTFYSTTAGPHFDLGARDGYTRVTSPLRRYLDMVAHWQLEASIKGETLPFSEEDIKNIVTQCETKLAINRHISLSNSLLWMGKGYRELVEKAQLRLTCFLLDNSQYPDPTLAYCLDDMSRVDVMFGPSQKLKAGTFVVCNEIQVVDPVRKYLLLKAPEVLTEENVFTYQ